jgi:hypothetical protein
MESSQSRTRVFDKLPQKSQKPCAVSFARVSLARPPPLWSPFMVEIHAFWLFCALAHGDGSCRRPGCTFSSTHARGWLRWLNRMITRSDVSPAISPDSLHRLQSHRREKPFIWVLNRTAGVSRRGRQSQTNRGRADYRARCCRVPIDHSRTKSSPEETVIAFGCLFANASAVLGSAWVSIRELLVGESGSLASLRNSDAR